eukprot:2112545-Prymnesium_polylepis.1
MRAVTCAVHHGGLQDCISYEICEVNSNEHRADTKQNSSIRHKQTPHEKHKPNDAKRNRSQFLIPIHRTCHSKPLGRFCAKLRRTSP